MTRITTRHLALALFVYAASGAAAPPPEKSDIKPDKLAARSSLAPAAPGFQGVRWGADVQTTQARFPKAARVNFCENPLLAQVREPLDYDCKGLELKPYVVAEIPFTVQFNFGQQSQTLTAVSLLYSGDVKGADGLVGNSSYHVLRMSKLRRALTDKYGSPASEAETQDDGVGDSFSTTVEWVTDGTLVSLAGEYFPSAGLEIVSINYAEDARNAADRL